MEKDTIPSRTPEKLRAYNATYKARVPAEIWKRKAVERTLRWKLKNPEKYKANQLAYVQSEKGRLKKIDARFKRKYRITLDQYNAMLAEQNGVCKICLGTCSRKRKWMPLCADHDHGTGEVRGLLCDACNVGISRFRDSIDRLKSAIAYLTK